MTLDRKQKAWTIVAVSIILAGMVGYYEPLKEEVMETQWLPRPPNHCGTFNATVGDNWTLEPNQYLVLYHDSPRRFYTVYGSNTTDNLTVPLLWEGDWGLMRVGAYRTDEPVPCRWTIEVREP